MNTMNENVNELRSIIGKEPNNKNYLLKDDLTALINLIDEETDTQSMFEIATKCKEIRRRDTNWRLIGGRNAPYSMEPNASDLRAVLIDWSRNETVTASTAASRFRYNKPAIDEYNLQLLIEQLTSI